MKVLNVHNFYRQTTGEDLAAREFAEALKGSEEIQVVEYYVSSEEFLKYPAVRKLMGFLKGNIPFYRPADFGRLIDREKPDVAFIHNLIPFINVWILKALKKNDIPIVCSVHNFRLFCPKGICFRNKSFCADCHEKSLFSCVFHNCMDSIFLSLLFSWRVFLYRKFLPYLWALTSPGEGAEEFHRRRLHNIRIIPFKEYLSMPENIVKIRPVKKDYVIFAGRIVEVKGIQKVLETAGKLTDVHFKICGDGPLLDYVRNLALSQKMQNVEFLGWQEREMVLELIASAAVLLLPSLSGEVWPRVITEALLLNTPVLGRIPCGEGMMPAVLEPESSTVSRELMNRLKEAFGYGDCPSISVACEDLKRYCDPAAYRNYFLNAFGHLKSD